MVGRPRKYPWDDWFGHSRTVLTYGVDYHQSQSVMMQMVRHGAKRAKVRVRLIDNRDEIIIEVLNGQENRTKDNQEQAVPDVRGDVYSQSTPIT